MSRNNPKATVLFAVGPCGGAAVLGTKGENFSETNMDAAEWELRESGANIDHHLYGDDFPEETGLYVWNGYIVYHGEDITWEGDIRPATYDDLKEFELPLILEHDKLLKAQEMRLADLEDDINRVKKNQINQAHSRLCGGNH